ncbi:MAG: hypothetical protein R2881_00770 [Eubacteriales bacterium]
MKQMQNGATQSPEQTAKAAGNMPNQPMGQKKPFLKRYGAFFLLLIAGVVTGLVLPVWQTCFQQRSTALRRCSPCCRRSLSCSDFWMFGWIL